MTFSTDDTALMREALVLAQGVRRSARPNPAVGCLLVADGEVIARGATEAPGGRHAEIVALDAAGDRARGAHVYVSLEPCAHFGRTPPCIDALIAAGVSAVTFAVVDPNPNTRGAGASALRRAGIEVREGLLADDARAVNAGFFSRMENGRPRVSAKIAQSLDGATAMTSGESQWITGPDARQAAHALRAASDAIVTGIGTVLSDDPQLTARGDDGTPSDAQPLRVVVDSTGRLPSGAAILRPPGDVLVVRTSQAPATTAPTLELAPDANGQVPLATLLGELAERAINDVMLEAGPTLTGAFAVAGLIDEYWFFIAPRLLGSATRAALATPPWQSLADGQRLTLQSVEHVGGDLLVRAIPRQGE